MSQTESTVLPALIDASSLISLFDRTDSHHARYNAMLADSARTYHLHTTWPCIAEASHLLADAKRQQMLRWVGVGGAALYPFDETDLLEMADWMQRYTAYPRTEMDLADASLFLLAADTGVTRIMTLDVRDFSRYRLPDGRAFEIL